MKEDKTMLKKEFIAGMVTGAIAFGGTGAAAGLLGGSKKERQKQKYSLLHE